MLPLQARVVLGAMAMNWHSIFPKAPELEPHYQDTGYESGSSASAEMYSTALTHQAEFKHRLRNKSSIKIVQIIRKPIIDMYKNVLWEHFYRVEVHPPSQNIRMILLPILWLLRWLVMSSNDTTNSLSAHVVFLIQTTDQSLIGISGR